MCEAFVIGATILKNNIATNDNKFTSPYATHIHSINKSPNTRIHLRVYKLMQKIEQIQLKIKYTGFIELRN
jgi:hypothetical protein